MNSVASGQSFGSAIPVVSGEDGGQVDIVGGQYHSPVSQEQGGTFSSAGCQAGKKK